jgi:hypothetical protein
MATVRADFRSTQCDRRVVGELCFWAAWLLGPGVLLLTFLLWLTSHGSSLARLAFSVLPFGCGSHALSLLLCIGLWPTEWARGRPLLAVGLALYWGAMAGAALVVVGQTCGTGPTHLGWVRAAPLTPILIAGFLLGWRLVTALVHGRRHLRSARS